MSPSTQADSSYFIWETPGDQVSVHIHLDVVDRMLAEVMRGFAAVPKRGAEVGGILIGELIQADRLIVRIDDFEPVPCEYRMGPSYLLSADEQTRFASTVGQWQPDQEHEDGRSGFAVGYFRSHTREGLSLASEDLEILQHYFPDSRQVALLIKPYATRVSVAGFFIRDEGVFPQETPLEFPFRRREMTGGAPPPRRPLEERLYQRELAEQARHDPGARAFEADPVESAPAQPVAAARSINYPSRVEHNDPAESAEAQHPSYPSHHPQQQPQYSPSRRDSYRTDSPEMEAAYLQSAAEPASRWGWSWIPVSLIFLVVGLVLGFLGAALISPRLGSSIQVGDLALSLSVTRSGDNLLVRWNRDAYPVRVAQAGLLEIDDGGYSKPVELEIADLQNGSVIYQNSTNSVRFRLIVYLDPRSTVTETLEWRK